jgi:polysaccharide export outer membrane protein
MRAPFSILCAVPALLAAATPALRAQSTMAELDDKTPLDTGDLISFRVIEDRDPTRVLSVLGSGHIIFPYIGKLQAKGKTCRQVALEVKKLLEVDYYYKATVLITPYQNPADYGKLYVVGKVGRPGPIELPPNEHYTASKAILAAGGFQKFANKKVRLIRRIGPDPKDREEIVVDVGAVLEKGQLEKDREVLPGDMIIVRQKLINF